MTEPFFFAKRSHRVLTVIEHIFQLVVGNAGVLHRVGRIGVPELTLNRGNIAVDQEPVAWRASCGVMALATTKPVPTGINLNLAIGLPRANGLNFQIQPAKVFQCAIVRLMMRSL